MIQLTRALARQLRAVLRKSVWAAAPRGARPPIMLRAERDELRVCAYDAEVAVEYRQPGRHTPEVLAVSAEVLDECEGRSEASVTLEVVEPNSVQARWEDAGAPQVRDYPARDAESLSSFPALPEQWATLESRFLTALADAANVAAHEHPRYALRRT